ncbi:MAG TPA: hypothetical protein VIL09_14990 [Microvirga sp.]|jgi:hypothetical protein
MKGLVRRKNRKPLGPERFEFTPEVEQAVRKALSGRRSPSLRDSAKQEQFIEAVREIIALTRDLLSRERNGEIHIDPEEMRVARDALSSAVKAVVRIPKPHKQEIEKSILKAQSSLTVIDEDHPGVIKARQNIYDGLQSKLEHMEQLQRALDENIEAYGRVSIPRQFKGANIAVRRMISHLGAKWAEIFGEEPKQGIASGFGLVMNQMIEAMDLEPLTPDALRSILKGVNVWI